MGRKRSVPVEGDLPKRVYFNRGRYYYVTKAGKWIPLGITLQAAIAAHKRIRDVAQLPSTTWASILRSAKVNARARGLSFELTRADLMTMVERSELRCEVSGIPFSAETLNGGRRRPWWPSIDRKDGEIGYSAENCRLVCVAANIAMNEWGLEVLEILVRHCRSVERRKTS